MSARAEYLEWRKTPAVGCLFARWLARHPDDLGQEIIEVSQSPNPTRVAAMIASRVDKFIPDERISAASLILPKISTIESLAEVAVALGKLPNWQVRATKLAPPPDRNLVCVHIIRQLPFHNTTLPSEILVFGPFKIFPATRRAPVVTFEIFVGRPMDNDPGKGTPSAKANLAHMDLSASGLPPRALESMWNGSFTGRSISLGGIDDQRAKAKVSFVISPSLAHKLRLEP